MNETIKEENIEDNSTKKRLRFIVAIIIIFIMCLVPFSLCNIGKTHSESLLSMNSNEQSITVVMEQEELKAEKELLIQNATTKYIITDSGLNIRNKNWEVIGTLPLNSAITVLKEQFTDDKLYDLVLYNNEYAYACNKYLGLQKIVTQITKDENKTMDVNSQKNEIKAQDNSSENWVYLGTFASTAYCSCRKCCGKWSGGPTASGKMPQAGRTIAVDPKVIPLGSQVKINGNIYTAEDTGSAIKGKKIDIYYNSHSEALNWGRRSIEVYVLRNF